MDLSLFITTTLTQIAEGVSGAKQRYNELGGAVCPSGFKQVEGGLPYAKEIPIQGQASLMSVVEFEVSLTNDTSGSSTGGIGVLFGAVNIGGKAESASSSVSLTRVKFNVPIKLPQ